MAAAAVGWIHCKTALRQTSDENLVGFMVQEDIANVSDPGIVQVWFSFHLVSLTG